MGAGFKAPMRRARLAWTLAAAALLAGCTGGGGLVAARVPDTLIQGNGGNGWDLDPAHTDAQPRSDAGGLVQRQNVAYIDQPSEGGNGGYTASLLVTTLKLFPSPSEAALQDLLEEQVTQRAQAQGIELQGDPVRGQRSLQGGHRTLFFVYTGKISRAGEVFTTVDATAKILGEVWNCPESGTSVAAVALAQVSSVRSLGGIPVATNTDTTNWREVAADPQGAVDGERGADGLVYNVRCTR